MPTEHILNCRPKKALFSSYAQGVSGAGRKHSGLIFWVKFVDLSSELFLQRSGRAASQWPELPIAGITRVAGLELGRGRVEVA